MRKAVLLSSLLCFALLALPALASPSPPAPRPADSSTKLTANATPPPAACGSSAHCVVLNWGPSPSASTDPTIGYNVYRGTTAGGESTTALNGTTLVAVGCSSSTNCTYTDLTATVEGQKYFYTVTAASPTRPQSGPSTEANATIPFTSAPSPPVNVTATSN